MLAITAVSTAMQYTAASNAAEATAQSTKIAGQLQQQDLAIQRDQQHEAAAQQVNEHARAAMRDAALFDTVSGEYGGGNSTDRAATVASIQRDEQLAVLSRNAEMGAQSSSMASMASSHNTQARLASIQRPSALGAALKIGGAAVSAYQGGAFKSLK